MERAYVYKITFEEVPHFYIGVRSRDPEGDPYLGSPKTHRCYWEIYTPKKQIMWVYDSWDEAYGVETVLIRQNWDNKYCLNRNARGAFSPEASVKGAKAINERRGNDPEFDAKLRENSAKNAKALHERMRNDPELDARCRGASAKSAKALNERRRNDPELDARCREACAKNAKKVNAQRWQCTVTGYISSPGPLSNYQKKRGIDPENRKRLHSPPAGYT